MEIMDNIIKKAKEKNKTIILPEATDERVIKATRKITDKGIAKIILIGNEEEIKSKAKKVDIDLSDIEIIDPVKSNHYEEFVKYFYELRKHKGMTYEKAQEIIKDTVYFGVMMVKLNYAAGLVSGAVHSSADTLRPALQIIKARENAGIVSSFFLMEFENPKYEKAYIFSDCGLVINPNSEELSEIAIESFDTYKLLIGNTPKVAMLSFSTKGSASSDETLKVIEATSKVKEKRPDILVDGELQLDSAIDKVVASKKAPESMVAGNANVLIFPNLDAGNIGYKLAERFGGAKAYGPITQGLKKAVNDLSRGCNAEDIVGAVAITCVQADQNED